MRRNHLRCGWRRHAIDREQRLGPPAVDEHRHGQVGALSGNAGDGGALLGGGKRMIGQLRLRRRKDPGSVDGTLRAATVTLRTSVTRSSGAVIRLDLTPNVRHRFRFLAAPALKIRKS